MKPIKRTNATTPEWDQARSFRDRMRSGSRNRLTAQVFLGKVTFELKEKLGIQGSGGDRRSKGQVVPLKTGAGSKAQSVPLKTGAGQKGQVTPLKTEDTTWKKICPKELGISYKTADRYVVRYQKALECSNDLQPAIWRVLRKPSAEITDEDFDAVAAQIDSLVESTTQAALRIELGITLEADDDAGEPADGEASDLRVSLEELAIIYFSSVPRKVDLLRKSILGTRDRKTYELLLAGLPVDDSRDGKPSLMGIKECLDEVIRNGIAPILKDIEDAMSAKAQSGSGKTRTRRPTNKHKQ